MFVYYIISDCLQVVLFCVFKQKTAYDMRISDWSSDVCSSDLMSKVIKNPKIVDILLPDDHPVGVKRLCLDTHYLETFNEPHVDPIGRASCRERVCPYV